MRCPSCGNETREGARFCDTCGVPIAARCAACGTLNRPSAQFCDGCGAPLTVPRTVPSPGEAQRRPPAPPPSLVGVATEAVRSAPQNIPEGERKTVTALFAEDMYFGKYKHSHVPPILDHVFGWLEKRYGLPFPKAVEV